MGRERYQVFDDEARGELGGLLRGHRQAALGSLGEDGAPHVTMVACALEEAPPAFLLHLSELAPHKARLRRDPRCSLMVFEPAREGRELLSLQRVSFACRAELLARDGEGYAEAKAAYLAALPKHEMMFSLSDFDLLRLHPNEGLWNAGFGRAYRVSEEELAAALSSSASSSRSS